MIFIIIYLIGIPIFAGLITIFDDLVAPFAVLWPILLPIIGLYKLGTLLGKLIKEIMEIT